MVIVKQLHPRLFAWSSAYSAAATTISTEVSVLGIVLATPKLATTSGAETSVEMLVAAAEDALDQAKRRGCNCVTITISSTNVK